MIPLSVLDLAPVRAGSTARAALREAVDLARLAERLGYRRYWFAEHHGMAAVASSAPEILIEHIASATSRIRVGSGGIMLPNHVPLRVAEVFHTLEALHPGRIDLGLGRAPGTDPATSRALRPFDAEYQAASTDLGWVQLHRREFTPLPSPEEAIQYEYSPQERVIVEANRSRHFIGTPFKVASTIRHLVELLAAEWGVL